MNKLVAKGHDLRQVADARRSGGIELGQLLERVADDLELAFHCSLRHGIDRIGCHTHVSDKRLNRQGCLAHIPQKGPRVTLQHRSLHGCG
jgi:hypothetical protein